MTSARSLVSLTHLLELRAQSEQTLTFVSGKNERRSVSFARLYEQALKRLASFQKKGLHKGSQLIVQTSDNEQFIEAFWACLLGGIVPVPVTVGSSTEQRMKLVRIFGKLNNPAVFIDKRHLERLQQLHLEDEHQAVFTSLEANIVLADGEVPDDGSAVVHMPEPADVAFIQFSSGSTSTPKGVVLTHHNLMVNISAIIEGCLMKDKDFLLSWMPLTHDMGLIGFHLSPLMCNASHALIPTDLFVRRPALWLTEIERTRATVLCSPNFGYQHVLNSHKPAQHAELDLSSVRLLFNGAEPISETLCKDFMDTMTRHGLPADAMYPVYGLAEASLAVTFPALASRFSSMAVDRSRLGVGQTVVAPADAASGVSVVAVGYPVPQIQVSIRDPDSQPLAERVIGHIRIRGENVTGGYYEEPELNEQLFDKDGWLDTGDLGFISDGQLFITGRAKDIVFVSGQNLYPHDLEEIVCRHQLVARGKLAISSQPSAETNEDQLLVFVVHRTDAAELLETARSITRVLAMEAGAGVHAVVPVPRIPKTTSGKVQRYLLVAALQQGDYEPLLQSLDPAEDIAVAIDEAGCKQQPAFLEATGNSKDTQAIPIQEQLLRLCNAQLEEQQSIAVDDNLFDLGISSLTLAQIHAAVEEDWPGQVEITDLFDYPTVRDLAGFLESKKP
ncbi:MAG: AMP-binding protein [Granulosicoccus sp.]